MLVMEIKAEGYGSDVDPKNKAVQKRIKQQEREYFKRQQSNG